jgi:uncharacterized repeat protein (TIGR03803 family)
MRISNLAALGMVASLWLWASEGRSVAQADASVTYTTLANFSGSNGRLSFGAPMQATDGNLYGTTYYGGAHDDGVVFDVTLDGTLSTVYSFCALSGCTDGSYSYSIPLQGSDGNFYGTTYLGGTSNWGTVFKLTPGGTLTTLHSFTQRDGSEPLAGLVAASDGSFYGTTNLGGSHSAGVIFKITPNGTYKVLHNFCSLSGCADGENSYAQLIQGTDGNLYGTSFAGGSHKFGTVFKITPAGVLTTLYNFCPQKNCLDGEFPQTGLVQASNGNFYGTTILGGAWNWGTIFQISPAGKLTTLYNVCPQNGCPDGQYLYASLIQASDNNLYGVMDAGGANGRGTIFKMTLSGTLTTLYNFCSQPSCVDGSYPTGLVQDTNGTFYGITADGGSGGNGVIFSLVAGLRPFIETEPTAAKVGATVNILGNNLTGTTSVTFNGTAASFTVVSSSQITATVPGATSGKVRVVTPSRTLSSNMKFQVTK